MRRGLIGALLVVAALLAAAAAFAGGHEQIKYNAADQAAARAVTIKRADLTGATGWAGGVVKPDISAPGAQILSSTLPEFAGSPFAVFDGTSMATPHVTASAALLLQLHPGWSVPRTAPPAHRMATSGTTQSAHRRSTSRIPRTGRDQTARSTTASGGGR